jgi:hemerythrin-like domain-containing protein
LRSSRIEQDALRNEWVSAAAAFEAFPKQAESHFSKEEHVFFPALEAATPSADGPTSVMRREHAQIVEFFEDLRDAIENHDARLLADTAETLLFLMQQHNSKEETVLHPMAERILSDDLLTYFTELEASS